MRSITMRSCAAEAPQAKVSAFKDYNSAWLALVQGRVDALTGSLNILPGFAFEQQLAPSICYPSILFQFPLIFWLLRRSLTKS